MPAVETCFKAEELVPKYKGVVNSFEEIVFLGKAAIENCIKELKFNDVPQGKKAEAATILQSLLEKAEIKPLLPAMRPRDWFACGDIVMSARAMVPLRFEKAKVISEPDDLGIIRMRFDSDHKVASTFIINYMTMKYWEFERLKTDPDFTRDWYLGKGIKAKVCGRASFAEFLSRS